jgi:predicted Ser/Thr protein kinase
MMHTLEQLRAGSLKGAKHIRLSCGLTEFPAELFTLTDTLEVLDLSGNKLSCLPDDFDRFTQLRILFCSDNYFKELPSVLGKCKQLSMIGFKSNQIAYVPENSLPESTRWLILTNNQIKELPASVGKCLPLQKLALAGNRLSALPEEMANCIHLELIRISANQLKQLPLWVTGLPKLAWLAFSGNPFAFKPDTTKQLPQISWKDLNMKELLGEGASGHIYKAHYGDKEVALKLFKGEVTSDGFPEDEMTASLAAGVFPGLVNIRGEISAHPENKKGLLMDLIPASYQNLGMPPSLDTCSRDTFKPGTAYTAPQILQVITVVASLARHLHARGIMHGDLYAHNTLFDGGSGVLMSDFGAASFYDKQNSVVAAQMERIEVRAFGCLLDDLLTHIEEKSMEHHKGLVKRMTELKKACMQNAVAKRPLFGEICASLNV